MKKYTIVKTPAEFAALEAHIDNFDYFAFDTETTGLNVRKNKVIGLSICGEIGTAFYLPLLTWNKAIQQLVPVWGRDKFAYILERLAKKDLITWNGSFDTRIVKNDFGIDLVPALLADAMMMKHTVQEEGPFGLKETLVELGEQIGFGDEEAAANEEQLALKANVIANGGIWLKSNKEMFKADLEVMGPYACKDADGTLRAAEYYRTKLEQEGLEEFFFDKEVMPLYKEVTIPMEEHGVKLDLPLIEQTKLDIEVDMLQLEKEILSDLNAIPEVENWLELRALAEFPPKPTGSFAQALCEIYMAQLPRTPSGKFSLTSKAIQKLHDCDLKSFLLGELGPFPELKLEELSWNLFVKSGLDKINISSKQQMGQITFDCLGIKPLGKTPKGSPQFDDDMIQNLADVHKLPWAIKLSNYNKLSKIRGTYIDRFLDAHEDGFYYFSYKQHGTISGRYSGDAQQMPRPKEEEELAPIVLKYNNLVRSFFIADEGRTFIDDDYESLEPHTFAHVSGDERIKDIFRLGHDFYSTIAIITEKLEGVSADKKAANYLGKVNKPKRQGAKPYSLGIPYGMEAFLLGVTLGIPTKEAQKLIDGYLSGFTDLANWMEESEEFVKQFGYIQTESGRIRHLPQVKELYKKHGDQLKDWRYRNTLIAKYSRTMSKEEAKALVQKMKRDYSNGLNNAKNFQIQGLAASIVNLACIAIAREFRKQGIQGHVCAQIHDQAIFDVPDSQVDIAKKIVQDLMENTTKLSVTLKAPPSVAKNWKEGH